MRILFAGDVVGRPAREYLKEALPRLRKKLCLDAIVVNGENSAGGSSITRDTAREIFESGVDVITSGDHIFKKKDAIEVLKTMDVIRPLNYGRGAPGSGYLIKKIGNCKLGVINLQGRVFMSPVDCPFNAVRDILEEIKKEAEIILVDMHAEATSEKVAMGYFLAGKVSVVVGTHTHIPTADARIINGATAYITDAGMTGSFDSVLGREKQPIIERFVTNMPTRFNLATGDVRLQGVVVDVDNDSGRAISIERIEEKKNGTAA
ncbi:MAG: TIGR00282 family metallophosphoesterase [Candidatus Omnitrophica bacterium]|nr:TIGR00282 family metallophosphoesterase [Candidatus Omnitrophota bacterium]